MTILDDIGLRSPAHSQILFLGKSATSTVLRVSGFERICLRSSPSRVCYAVRPGVKICFVLFFRPPTSELAPGCYPPCYAVPGY